MIIVDSIWLDWDFFFFAHIKKWKCFNNNKKKSAGVTMNCHVWFVPSRTGSIGQNSEPVSVFFFSVFFFSVFFVCTGAIDDLPIGKVRSALALLSRAFQIETWYQQVQQYFFFCLLRRLLVYILILLFIIIVDVIIIYCLLMYFIWFWWRFQIETSHYT